jgi:prepilin-type N-terminal cleavage/methylation domain-containing protein
MSHTERSNFRPRYVGVIRAFTLLELLMVIAVIAVLAGILIPAVSAVRASADNTVGVSNLRQVYSAIQLYSTDHNGAIVPVRNQNPGVNMDWRETLYLGGYLDGVKRDIGGDEDISNAWATYPILGNPAHYKQHPDNPFPVGAPGDAPRATFAMNVRMGSRSVPLYHHAAGNNLGLEFPAKTFLVGDGRYTADGASGYGNVVWPSANAFFDKVYKDSANICYGDGHFVLMPVEDIPLSEAANTEDRLFWRGRYL